MVLATVGDQVRLGELIKFSTELTWSIIEPILAHEGIQGVLMSDPMASGDLISPDTFRMSIKN